jgi:hypothetical protein
MRRKLLASLIVCTIALLLVLLMPTVLATQPEYVSGWLHYSPHPVLPFPEKMADDNVFLNTWEEAEWNESIVGNARDEPCRVVIHGANQFPNPTTFDFRWYTGISNFTTAIVGSKTGGLIIRMVGKAEFGQIWHGEWVILSGTDGLEGIHGQGTWSGQGAGGMNTWGYVHYEGWIHFEPD